VWAVFVANPIGSGTPQIEVELSGREVWFHLADDRKRVVEHATFEDLAKAGVLPDIPPYKWNDGGSAP